MPSVRARTFAPRRPFERPAPAFACPAAWPPRGKLSTPFHRHRPFRALVGQAPVRAFRCHRVRASLSLGAACRLLQPGYDARAHPTSLRPSHASGAFAPLRAGTNRCRLRWPFDALPRRGPASHDLHEAGRGPERSSEDDARFANEFCACPPRGAPGTRVAGAIVHRVWRSRVRLRPGQDPLRMPPRERQHRREDRGAFCRNGTLTRPSSVTHSCAPGPRPRHAASVEALLGGSRAFVSASLPPASDEESDGGGSARQAPVAEAPAD